MVASSRSKSGPSRAATFCVGPRHASRADPNSIVAFSLFGEVYVTEDAGASWRKIAREFGEIRTAVWVPN